MSAHTDQVKDGVATTTVSDYGATSSAHVHKEPEVLATEDSAAHADVDAVVADEVDGKKKGRLAYFKTKDFWIILFLG